MDDLDESGVSRVRRSIVVVDLAHFTKSIHLYERLGEPATRLAHDIEIFFLRAFERMNLPVDRPATAGYDPGRPLLKYTGDGAILHFDSPELAVEFGEWVQKFSQQENQQQAEAEAKRVFRVGVATGEVEIANLILAPADLAGSLIGTAARLEAACNYGCVLIDEATRAGLGVRQSNYQGPVNRPIGKASDGMHYTAFECCINDTADADFRKQSAWWIYRRPDSVVQGIVWRLRHQMPAFDKGWGLLKLLAGNRSFATAGELIDWASQTPDIISAINGLRNCTTKNPDEQRWAEELLLLFSCRSIDFSVIAPLEQVIKESHPNNAALVGWVPSTSAFVAAACMAGLTGTRVYLGPSAGALEIRAQDFPLKSVNNQRLALEQIYRKLLAREPEVYQLDDELLGEVIVELEAQRGRGKSSAVCFNLAGSWSVEEKNHFLREFAELVNHLVVGLNANDVNLLMSDYQLRHQGAPAAFGTRLQYSFQSILAAGPRS